MDISQRSAHKNFPVRRQQAKGEARNNNIASWCKTSAAEDNCIRIMRLPCEVKHMGFYQYREPGPDGRSYPLSLQIMKGNPDSKT
jgi:hypothetical protein